MATLKIRKIMIRCILFNIAHKNTSKVFGIKKFLSLKCIFLNINQNRLFGSVCEFFGETIRNMFGCGCYFVIECYGCV